MTRRELVGPAEDVESQGRDCNISDGFSERSSTLPAYQDVVGDTPTLAPEDSKSNSDGKNVRECAASSQAVEDGSLIPGSLVEMIFLPQPLLSLMPRRTVKFKSRAM